VWRLHEIHECLCTFVGRIENRFTEEDFGRYSSYLFIGQPKFFESVGMIVEGLDAEPSKLYR
jgi:hypothetical protein